MPRARANTLNSVISRGFAAQLAALAVLVVLACALFVTDSVFTAEERRELEELREVEQFRAEALTAQSSLRGFTLVERPQFLEPYLEAVPRARALMRELDRTAEPSDRDDLLRVGRAFEVWRVEFAEPTIALVRAGRVDRALALARTGAGKRRFDRLKALVEERTAADVVELEEQGDRRMLFGALSIVLILTVSLFIAAAAWRLLRKIKARVVTPMSRLSEAAGRLGEGDLSVRVVGEGVDELEVVGASFNQMASEVQSVVEGLRELDEMKTEFVSSVSHELRTPLTSIRGFVDALAEGDAGPMTDEALEFLAIVRRNTLRLEQLVDDLLTLARLEAGGIEMDLQPLALRDVLTDVADDMRRVALDRGVELECECPGSATVVGDELRLHQATANLVSNAIKFTPEGGRVSLNGRVRDGEVLIEVVDTGVGVPKAELGRLTDRFYRASTAKNFHGTGLGLAITREIVERHGGRIEAESEVLRGSTFRIVLAEHRPAPSMGGAAEPVLPGAREHG